MTPDESTIEILENRIESLTTIAENCSRTLEIYMEGMFGTPDDTAVKAPDAVGMVENAPFIDKVNFTLDKAFNNMYEVETGLDLLKSTIPSRISGCTQVAQNTDIE